MKQKLIFWVERFFYNPRPLDRFVSFLFSPFTLLYCLIVFFKYKTKTPQDMGIKVISIGNLTVGGSGKTPLVSALAKRYENSAVVLRGYGRESKGLIVVKDKEKILCDFKKCGDEALVYASKLENSIIIVSENRKEGILKAKDLGAKIVFLDDGYSKHDIKKLDFLIDVKTKNDFCLPAGPYREKLWKGKKVTILKEDIDFKRKVSIENSDKKLSLVTAIARPQRLDRYLPKNLIAKHYFADHYTFTKDDIAQIFKNDGCEAILVTLKDYVKLKDFGFEIVLMDLELEVDERVFDIIDKYN